MYCDSVDVQLELSKTCQLRCFLTFSSGLPLALLETYIVFTSRIPVLQTRILIAAASLSVFSASAALATFRKREKDYRFLETIITWPGTLLKFLWRLGEISCRVLILGLFTQLYTLWVFMVLLCHWICMLTSLLMENKLKPDRSFNYRSILKLLATSYTYIFCYVNISTNPEKYRFVVFYLIMSVENALLLLLWIQYDLRDDLHLPVAICSGAMFVMGIICALLYYHCYHVKSNDKLALSNNSHYIQQCINCKLSLCVAHDKRWQHSYNNTHGDTWWLEVRAPHGSTPHQDSSDHLYPIEGMINSKALPPGVSTRTLLPFSQDNLESSHAGKVKYLKVYKDIFDSASMTSGSVSCLIPNRMVTSCESASDCSYIWDHYDLQDQENDPHHHPVDIQEDVSQGPHESTDTNTHPRSSQKRSDSGFSASTSSRSGSRLSPFSQGEYVLYISDNDDSDFSTSMMSTDVGEGGERGARGGGHHPKRYIYFTVAFSVNYCHFFT